MQISTNQLSLELESIRARNSELMRFTSLWRETFPPDRRNSLYAIQMGDDGPVKIGIATKPWERLATLQTASPARLRGLAAWPGSVEKEAALHEIFAEDRLEGEWFKPSPELITFVEWFGFPTCEFVKPQKCMGYLCMLPTTALPATCVSCEVPFDKEPERV
jgi:hypothetical protein